MKNTLAILLVLLFISCNNKPNTPAPISNQDTLPRQVINNEVTKSEAIAKDTFYQSEIMANRDILFNGKLGRYFKLKDFKRVFIKADSARAASENDCDFSFSEIVADVKNLHYAKYIYKDGSVFENYKEEVLITRFEFRKNNFMSYKGHKIDATTTIDDLKKLFPNAIKKHKDDDREIQVLYLGDSDEYDDETRIYFKNKHAYYIYWWLPC